MRRLGLVAVLAVAAVIAESTASLGATTVMPPKLVHLIEDVLPSEITPGSSKKSPSGDEFTFALENGEAGLVRVLHKDGETFVALVLRDPAVDSSARAYAWRLAGIGYDGPALDRLIDYRPESKRSADNPLCEFAEGVMEGAFCGLFSGWTNKFCGGATSTVDTVKCVPAGVGPTGEVHIEGDPIHQVVIWPNTGRQADYAFGLSVKNTACLPSTTPDCFKNNADPSKPNVRRYVDYRIKITWPSHARSTFYKYDWPWKTFSEVYQTWWMGAEVSVPNMDNTRVTVEQYLEWPTNKGWTEVATDTKPVAIYCGAAPAPC